MNTLILNRKLKITYVQAKTADGNKYIWAVIIARHGRVYLERVVSHETLAIGTNKTQMYEYARKRSPESTAKVYITRDRIIHL